MQRRDWVFLIVVSFVVAFCGVFGVSYVMGEGYPYFRLWAEVLLTCLSTIVVAIVFLFIEAAFFSKCLSAVRRREEGKGYRLLNRLTPQWSLRSIALFAAIMALLWLPWYIANFPGGTYWDTYYQIFQVYPENHPIAVIPWAEIYNKTLTDAWLVDHHPVFTTVVYGAFGWVSDQLTGNWMAGIAAFCIIQGLLHVIAFTAAVAYMRRVGCPPLLNLLSYAFFALAPFISTWALCMVKDSFFGLFYVPYFMLLFEVIRTKGACMGRPRNMVLFALCALGLCLTKKTGIFVVVATAVIGIIAFRRHRQACEAFIIQGLLPTVVVMVIFPLLLFPALNIQAGGTQETLGPLFQQTARVLHDYPNDVSTEEEAAIRGVLDYDKLAAEYRFDFEDSVKYRYRLEAGTADIIRYLQAYAAMGLRHPDSYFGAFMGLAGFYVAPTAPINIRMVTVDTKMGDEQRYMLWNPDELDGLRLGLDDAYDTISKIPVLDLPLLIVTYAFWLPALLAFVTFRNRMKCWTLFIPPLVLLGFCIIAPVYDARYVIPILNGAPLFFCAIVVLLRNSTMKPPTIRRDDVRSTDGLTGPQHAER